eukprot:9502025-Pyramimonas_sp.AAC.1
MYSDEVVPGNALSDHNTRSMQAVYWSWADLQYPVLSDELAWNTLTAPTSDTVKCLRGGMSELFKYAVECFTKGTSDIRKGALLQLPGESAPRVVYREIFILVQDERAHKYCTGAMGATGHKICGICRNVVNFKSSLLPCPNNYLVPSAEVDVRKFEFHSHDGLMGIQKRLKDLHDANEKTKLGKLETLFGYNFIPTGLLQSPDVGIDLSKTWAWDWMHSYFIGGAFPKEVTELLSRLTPFGLGGKEFDEYLQLWSWPGCYAKGSDVCASHADHSPSGDASSMLSCAPVLRKYLLDVVWPSGHCQQECI